MNKFTQVHFANILGVTQGQLSDWENGRHTPREMRQRYIGKLLSAEGLIDELL